MRRFFYLIMAMALFFYSESYGQMNRKSIKKNNRRLSSFRGKKYHFGPEKIYNSLGISLNAMNYYGDLAPTPSRVSTDIAFTRPGIGISLTHRFGPRYQLTAGFLYGNLRGSDAESADKDDAENGVFRYNRNLSFRNRVKELSLTATFDAFKNQATYISRAKFTPYIYLGIAVFHHNPQAQVPQTDVLGAPMANAGEWVDLQPIGTEGQYANLAPTDVNYGIKPYKLIQVAIPFGIGARFRVNEVIDFSAEIGFRYLFTDYIDDVSGNYVDLGVFGTDEQAKALSYRSHEIEAYKPGANPNLVAYVGRDGRTYETIAGYGREGQGENWTNKRGNVNDRDIYTVTTFRLSYILGKTFHRAKFR